MQFSLSTAEPPERMLSCMMQIKLIRRVSVKSLCRIFNLQHALDIGAASFTGTPIVIIREAEEGGVLQAAVSTVSAV